MPEDHVLTKSFYLLDISRAVITAKPCGWKKTAAGATAFCRSSAAMTGYRHGPRRVVCKNRQQNRVPLGINVMMYALTGNYKADQVHIPAHTGKAGSIDEHSRADHSFLPYRAGSHVLWLIALDGAGFLAAIGGLVPRRGDYPHIMRYRLPAGVLEPLAGGRTP